MTDYLEQALELTKAQAAVRVMTEEEMTAMISSLTASLKKLSEGDSVPEAEPEATPLMDPRRSIKERSVICLECGKTFKVITQKHLQLHGLDAVAYREKWGLKKGTALTCKELQRKRKQKMQDMKLWEKRAAAREMANR